MWKVSYSGIDCLLTVLDVQNVSMCMIQVTLVELWSMFNIVKCIQHFKSSRITMGQREKTSEVLKSDA